MSLLFLGEGGGGGGGSLPGRAATPSKVKINMRAMTKAYNSALKLARLAEVYSIISGNEAFLGFSSIHLHKGTRGLTSAVCTAAQMVAGRQLLALVCHLIMQSL